MRMTIAAGGLIGVLVAGAESCGPEPLRLPPTGPFHAVPHAADGRITHGVATGDVTDRSAEVWVRTEGPARVNVEWEPDSDGLIRQSGPAVKAVSSVSGADRDYTTVLSLGELKPDTAYRYRVRTAPIGVETAHADGRDQRPTAATGRFRTAPSPDVPRPVTFLWSGDLGGQQHCRQGERGYPVFDAMRAVKPAFALLLGDLVYADERCSAPPNAPGSDFIAESLDEYRAKHRYQREASALQAFLADVPVLVQWDDHEVRNNFAGSADPLMPLGRRAFQEYWPLRSPPEEPTRLHRRVRWGKHLELFLLDTRQYRSPNAQPDGIEKTMLGHAQVAWLLEGLTQSTATWKVIGTSIPLSNAKGGTLLKPGNDSWARATDGTGFFFELQRIVDTLLTQQVRNVVWLAADVHYAQVNAYDPDRDGTPDFYEGIAGPLSAAPFEPAQPDGRLVPTTLVSGGGYSNFGLVTVTGSDFRVEIRDEEGRTRVHTTFPAKKLGGLVGQFGHPSSAPGLRKTTLQSGPASE